MTITGIIKNSLLYRLASEIQRTAQKYGPVSFILKLMGTPPSYVSPRAAEGSLILGTASRAARLVMSPLSAAGEYVRQQARGSRVLNLKVPAALAHSQALRAAAGIRVESALWLVMLYPVVDYLLRAVPSLGFLSSGWDELLLLFIILAWPAQMALRGRINYRYTGLDLPVLVYIGVTLFLLFMRSRNVSLAVEGARVYLEYLLWFFIGSNLILNRGQFNALMRGMVGVAAVVAAIGIFQQITGVQTPAHWVDQAEAGIQTRVFSIVVSPNVLGSLLVLFIMVTAGQVLSSRGRLERVLCLAALAAMLACMVFTYSRGAWLALGMAVTVFSLLYNPRLLVVMAAGAAAAIELVPGIGARLSYMFSAAYLASSQRAGRLALWQAALDKFRQDPLFGTGFGSFGGAVAARRIPGSFYVDNYYLKTLAESGLVGLLALLWLLASALRCGYAAFKSISDSRLKIMAAAILAGLMGIAAHNAVENIFEVPMMATYFWLMTGMLLALPRIEE